MSDILKDLKDYKQNQNIDYQALANISKGQIITLFNSIFSFLNDKSLLQKENTSFFEKYVIDNNLINTMKKVFHFFNSNFPEKGKETFHDLLKEKYLKVIKYLETNDYIISESNEILFKYSQIKGLILIWLIELKYESEYYDELTRLINKILHIKETNNNNSNSKTENKYLNKFLNTLIKFPYIKKNQNIIIQALEVNECSNDIINKFKEDIQIFRNQKTSTYKQDLFSPNTQIANSFDGKQRNKPNSNNYKNISKFPSITISRRKSFAGNNKGVVASINSSGFYTPEFKNSKRWSLSMATRHLRNNHIPKIIITNNNNCNINSSFSNKNTTESMKDFMQKCQKGKKIDEKNEEKKISTKSKFRIAVRGHFYSNNDFENNIDIIHDNSKKQIENFKNLEEFEDNIVSVDEVPINTNLSIISDSTSINLGIEPDKVIEETKEEEEEENEQQPEKKVLNEKIFNNINDNKNNNNDNFQETKNNNKKVNILSDSEVEDFFCQQFNKKSNKNKEKRNNNFDKSLLNNNSKKNNTKKDKSFDKEIIRKNSSKENIIISGKEKAMRMKKYSTTFGLIKQKSHKNIAQIKKNNGHCSKGSQVLVPCTKGKEMLNNEINNKDERLPTESVAKRNLLSLYNQKIKNEDCK